MDKTWLFQLFNALEIIKVISSLIILKLIKENYDILFELLYENFHYILEI